MLQRLKAYAELLRISNTLTAVADVWMGMIVATGTLAPWTVSVPLTIASILLYHSGMVLNDLFDAEQDAKERPTRPIPSGRTPKRTAAMLGYSLLVGGVLSAGLAGYIAGNWNVVAVAFCLAVLVVAYNRRKATAVGPLLMALCRMLNVLLGLSLANQAGWNTGDPSFKPVFGGILAGHFLYVVGLTLFARSEAETSRRSKLLIAAAVCLLGLATYALAPVVLNNVDSLQAPLFRWFVLWAVIALLIGRRFVAALLQPTPRHVQSAVGNAIQSIILIDAALAWGYAGPFWGLAILALLPPTMLLARFVPQT